MIEKIVIDYLSEKLKDVGVYMEEPIKKTSTFILVEKTSGTGNKLLKNAMIAVQSYAPSLYEASLLNERVKDEMLEMNNLSDISKVVLNSDYNFTDTVSKRYRYQAVYEITYY